MLRNAGIKLALVIGILLGATSLSAVPLKLEYTVTGSASPWTYTFTLTLDNNDSSWASGQGWGWFIFGDAASAASPLTAYTHTSGFPVGSWTGISSSSGGHNGPTFTPVTTNHWIPTAIGQSITWIGTSTANLAQGQLLWSTLNHVGGAVAGNFVVATRLGASLTTSVNSLNLGSTTLGTPGTQFSYTVSGTTTTASTSVTAPSGVEISLTSGSGYMGSLTIANTGSWGPVTIFARLIGTPIGSVSGNITHATTGAATRNVSVSGNVMGPTISTSTNSLNLGSTPQGTPGSAVNYTVSGTLLSSSTTITPPTGVELSLSQTTGFSTNPIVIATTGSWGPTTIWARLEGTPAGSISGNITHVSSGATTVNVAVNGTVTPPTVSTSQSSINLGSTPQGTPGSGVSYTVSGSALSGPTTITAPTGVEVSLSQTTGYAASIQIATTPSYTNTTVWARLTGASAMIVSGNITHAAAGATTVNVSVSGNTWTYSTTPTSLNLGVTSVGTPGTPQSYDLTGAGLVANTVVNAPANFEISLSQAGTYGASLNINQMPTLSATIWVRLTGASLGTFNGNVTNVAGTASANVAVTGVVSPPNNLTLTRNGPSATTMVDNDAQGAGGNGLVILDFTLATAQAAWTVTDLVFTASGTADEQTGLNFLALYEDTNTNGTFDGPGTDTLATAAAGTSFNGANGTYTATLANGAWAASTTRRFFLVCRLAGTATAGQTIIAELTTVNATSGGGGAIVGAPTSGTAAALTINAATLTATLVGPMAFTTVNNNSQGAGNNGHVVCEFTLAGRNDTFTVTSMVFTESGTMDGQADLNLLALYLDNGNGTFDGPGTDTLATTAAGAGFSAPNGTYTATLTGGTGTFTMNQTKRYFLVAGLAGTASPGETLRVALTSVAASAPSGGTVAGTPTAASSALVIDVAILTVNGGPANPTLVTREQTGAAFQVMVGNFRMTSSNADFVISGFTLSTSGGGNWTSNLDAATGVQIYRDTGNGTFEPTDTLLFSGAGATPSVSCNFTANQTIAMNTDVDFWVVYNVLASAGGSPAEVFNSGISAASDIQAVTTGGMVALGTIAPTSGSLRVVIYALTSITPTASLPGGGAAITITGSGFALPVTLTIGGVACPGTASVNAGGTQITGLTVPPGSGTNLPIVLNTNNLGAKTLTQTFSYSGVFIGGSGGGGGGGGGGCAATVAAAPVAILLPTLIALWRRRRRTGEG